MSPIRLGFVGLSATGWASYTLVPPLLEEPLSSKYTLTAVSTTNPTSASACAEKYSKLTSAPVKAYHGSTEQIANDPNVDMVAVSVRTPAHVDAALPVLRAKKSLFVEWPAGMHLAGTNELAETAKKNGVRTLVGFQTRQAAYVKKASTCFQEGRPWVDLGSRSKRFLTQEFWVESSRHLWYVYGLSNASALAEHCDQIASLYFPGGRGPTGYEPYRYIYDVSNGTTMVDIDAGHITDMFHYLFGPIATVTAHLANQYPAVQLVDFSGKAVGEPIPQDDIHHVVFGGQFGNTDATALSVDIRNVLTEHGTGLFWVIDGERGTIKLRADGMKGQTFMKAQPEVWLNGEKLEVEMDTEAQRSARSWSKFADGAEGEYPTLEDAVRAKRVVDAIFTSSREGRKVNLS
ncbi:transcription regulator gal80 [Paramarasmius palmivorus]|uniref:Transcription regulator gal80 n=1 Tax=Paramarasmius palmivorus TaxID=297713 RepID=A0AAW0C1I4_9AGAR